MGASVCVTELKRGGKVFEFYEVRNRGQMDRQQDRIGQKKRGRGSALGFWSASPRRTTHSLHILQDRGQIGITESALSRLFRLDWNRFVRFAIVVLYFFVLFYFNSSPG